MNILFPEGTLRVQLLSPTLVRLEEPGPKGFEDRTTFAVLDRCGSDVQASVTEEPGARVVRTPSFTLRARPASPALHGVTIALPDGRTVFDGARAVPAKAFLPEPRDPVDGWCFADAPRLVPPAWGALPPPDLARPDSGWDASNPARDVYVFLPGAGGRDQLVRDILRLTGAIPLPPLALLGVMDSRYYPYRQDEALAIVDRCGAEGIPLDTFVLDTDWRVGASHGYGVNTDLLPDFPAFARALHARGVRLMLNDHPEPAAPHALDPRELRYRRDGLTSLLELGADYWWFDRNWHVSLGEPAPGLSKEVWGMRLYHDIAQAQAPDHRVGLMSNVEGIDNGRLNGPSSPAAHRFPIWWTGDTRATWDALAAGVRNAVRAGVHSLLPYVSEDLGGHHDLPDDELYLRFVQFGALSPICRLHCSYKLTRHPWDYGTGATAADYLRLRHRLLPTLYTAARASHDTGLPITRRCDLEWPGHADASADTQYLLGPDLLVAPVLEAAVPLAPVPAALLTQPDGTPGLKASYFANDAWSGAPRAECCEAQLLHGWWGQPPVEGLDGKHFSARWDGVLGPVPEDGVYRIGLRTDDGIRLTLDGQVQMDRLHERGRVYRWVDVPLKAGARVPLCVEFRALGSWNTMLELLWGRADRPPRERSLWMPPGPWRDAWSGAAIEGPCYHTVSPALEQVPLFVRAGGIVFSRPDGPTHGRACWPEVHADIVLAPGSARVTRELYEDDGETLGYQRDACRRTGLALDQQAGRVTLAIRHAGGQLAPDPAQRIVLRIHGLAQKPSAITVNGSVVEALWTNTRGLLPLGGLAAHATPHPVLELSLPRGNTDHVVAF